MERVKIAHISDLHFSDICLSPWQFFSKRWLGNLNLLFRRKREFDGALLEHLIDLFQQHHVDVVLITGDLSTTGQKKEFQQAKALVKEFEDRGLKVFAVPGNHDHYTMRGWKKKLFYDFFQEARLKEEGVSAIDLNASWTLVALDTALATSLTSSRGLFSEDIERRLASVLSSIPSKRNILLMNHFPLFEHQHPSKTMQRAPQLRDLLKRFPNVRLYLHGHTHSHCVADLRSHNLPIIVDSGSTAHSSQGTWNLIELSTQEVHLHAFKHISQFFDHHSWSLSYG